MSKLVISLDGSHIVAEDADGENGERKSAASEKKQTLVPYFGIWRVDTSNDPLALFPAGEEEIARQFVATLQASGVKVVTSIVELPKVKLVTRTFIKSLRESLRESFNNASDAS